MALWTPPTLEYDELPVCDHHATEGYPTRQDITPIPRYTKLDETKVLYDATVIREEKRIIGCDYEDASTGYLLTADKVGIWHHDMLRRLAYQAMVKLRRLISIVEGPPSIIDQDAGGHTYSAIYEGPCSGSGTTITFTYDPGGTGDLRDMRHYTDTEGDEVRVGGVSPGDWVRLSYAYASRWAQIEDVLYYYDGNDKCQLTLTNSLASGSYTSAFILKEPNGGKVPIWQLDLERADIKDTTAPAPCRHAVKQRGNAVTSMLACDDADDLPTTAGINGDYVCAKLDQTGVDLSQFAANNEGAVVWPCNNTSCPYYEQHHGGYPKAADFAHIFGSLGRYIEFPTPGLPDYSMGRVDITGIFALIGLPVGDPANRNKIYGPYRDFDFFSGQFKHHMDTVDGVKRFRDFYDQQLQRAADGDDERDSGTLLSAFVNTDPMDHAQDAYLVDRDGGTPGRTAEYNVPRLAPTCIGGLLPSSSSVQRRQTVKHRAYTSDKFLVPVASGNSGFDSANETYLGFSDSLTDFGDASFYYNTIWKIPRMCQQAGDTFAVSKGSAVVEVQSVSGDLLTVEFALGEIGISYINGMATATTYGDFGGNVVKPDIAWEIWNRGTSRSVGSREDGLYPGDIVEFAIGGEPIGLTCVYAEAYAGSADGTARYPTSEAGIPEVIKPIYNKRDKAVLVLEGRNGQAIKTFITLGGTLGACSIKQSGVCPATIDDTGADVWAPVLKRVKDGAVTTLTYGTDYRFDPVRGEFYLNTSGWDAGSWNLYCESQVYDVRAKVCPSDYKALIDLPENLCKGYVATLSTNSMDIQTYTRFTLNSQELYQTGFSLVRSNLSWVLADDGVNYYRRYEGTGNPVYWWQADLHPAYNKGTGHEVVDLAWSKGDEELYMQGTGMAIWDSTRAWPEDHVYADEATYTNKYYSVEFPANMLMMTSAEIAEAWIVITLDGGAYTNKREGTLGWDSDTNTQTSTTNVTQVNAPTMGCAFFKQSTDVNGDIEMTPLGLAVPSALVTQADGTKAATVDVTDVIKTIVDTPLGSDDKIVAAPAGAADNHDGTPLGVAMSWVLDWTCESIDNEDYPWALEASWTVEQLYYSSFQFGGLHIRLSHETLIDSIKWHMSADNLQTCPKMLTVNGT